MYVLKHRKISGGFFFFFLLLAVAEWSFANALDFAALEIPVKVFWSKVSYIGIVNVPPLWLLFSLQYTQHGNWIKRRRAALLWIVPICVMMLVATNEWHGLVWPSVTPSSDISGAPVIYAHGTGFFLNALYSYILLIIGTIFLISFAFRSPNLFKSQAWALVIGAIIPWLGNAVYISGLSPFPFLDLTPVAFTITGLTVAWGIFRFHLLDIVPIAYDVLFSHLHDAVLVIDTQERIVNANASARKLFGITSEAIGKDIKTVFAMWSDLCSSSPETVIHQELMLDSHTPERWIDADISPLFDRNEQFIGRLIVIQDITERKLAQTWLKASEEKWRRLFDEANDAIFVADEKTGELIDCNYAATELVKRSKQELIGQHQRILHPQSRGNGQFSGMFMRHLTDAAGKVLEEQVITKDGFIKEVEIKANLMEIGGHTVLQGVFRDISERKQMERDLREREVYYRSLFENSPDAAYVLDLNGKFLSVNRATSEISGYSIEELFNMTFEPLLIPEDADRVKNHFVQTLGGGSQHYEATIVKKDGVKVILSVTNVPIIVNEKIIGVYGIAQDITERKKAEQQILTSLREKEVLIKEIHHRVKNNLQIIKSLISLQSQNIQDEKMLGVFADIQNRVMSMAIVHERLYRSGIFTEIKLSDYIENMSQYLFDVYSIDRKKIVLKTDIENIPMDMDIAIPCGLIISELVSNALKHAFSDGRTGEITVGFHLISESRVQLSIQDRGIGIPEHIDVKSPSRFGLWLVNILTEQLGGSLSFKKEGGTAVIIEFPLKWS